MTLSININVEMRKKREKNEDFLFVFIKLGKYLTFEVTDGMNEMEKSLLFLLFFLLHLLSCPLTLTAASPGQLSYFFFSFFNLCIKFDFFLFFSNLKNKWKKCYFDSFVMLISLLPTERSTLHIEVIRKKVRISNPVWIYENVSMTNNKQQQANKR
jgi:hypothetical protein